MLSWCSAQLEFIFMQLFPLVQNYLWNSWRPQDTRPDVEGPQMWVGLYGCWSVSKLVRPTFCRNLSCRCISSELRSHDHWRRLTCCCITSRLPCKQTCELCPSTPAWPNDADSIPDPVVNYLCFSYDDDLSHGSRYRQRMVYSIEWLRCNCRSIFSIFSLPWKCGARLRCCLLSWRSICTDYSHHLKPRSERLMLINWISSLTCQPGEILISKKSESSYFVPLCWYLITSCYLVQDF